jgi:CheY-like chemotaxis protein
LASQILVIEDNPANLELMIYLLRAFGHTTLSALDGEEGLARAMQDRPDLIICDIHLPKMDGYEVARRLKLDPECRTIPAVAVTASAMVGDRDRVLKAGFDGYLTKPITPETFVGQIEAFLRSKAF